MMMIFAIGTKDQFNISIHFNNSRIVSSLLSDSLTHWLKNTLSLNDPFLSKTEQTPSQESKHLYWYHHGHIPMNLSSPNTYSHEFQNIYISITMDIFRWITIYLYYLHQTHILMNCKIFPISPPNIYSHELQNIYIIITKHLFMGIKIFRLYHYQTRIPMDQNIYSNHHWHPPINQNTKGI